MDAQTREAIMQAVRTAVQQTMDACQERWLSGKELCNQFQCFTPTWLKVYGYLLPRIQATVTEEDGSEHRTGWAYPRNKIQRMIAEGRLEFSTGERVAYRASGTNKRD